MEYIELNHKTTYNYSSSLINPTKYARNPSVSADGMYDLTEIFTYENLDRLTTITQGTNIRNISYQSNGNINSKYDAGSYSYDPVKIHSISKITDTSCTSAIDQALQNITYTPFKKVKTIQQHNDSLIYTYGQDMDRRKMQLYENGQLVKNRIYCGMYEKETLANSTVKEYCYIAGGSGVTAVLINQDMYYLRRDVQGTITGLIDTNGNLAEEYSYDACLSRCSREGRRRNPTDWTYDSVPQAQYLYRGYTMHEMLDEFGLINMNGRCYDPVVGRFLSPDIIVQNPNNTQCYNRYSYCINNPLKYSDPSGWVYDQSWTHRHNANIVNHNFLDRLWGHNWTFDEKEEWNALIEATGGNSLNNAGEAVDLLEIYGNNLKMDNSLSIFNNSFFTIYVDPEIKEQYEALKEAKQYKLAIELIINTYDLDKNIKASGESVEGLYEIRPVPGYGMVTKSPSQENKYDNSGNRIPYLIEVGIGTLNKETFAYVLFSTFHEILHVYEFEFLGLYGGNMDPRREFLSYANAVLFAAYNFTTCRIDQETFNFWKSQAKSNFNNISDFYILGQNRYRYYNRLLDNMNSTTYQPY